MDKQKIDKATACLLGGAVGDALGSPVEFYSLPQIRQSYPRGIRLEGHGNLISDDTQMTLFTAEGLIRALVRGYERGVCDPASVVHHALLRWYTTQGGRTKIDVDLEVGLVTEPRMHTRRAPGNTCLAALAKARKFGEAARNSSKGCGTIMRVAPVALVGMDVTELAIRTSALTHGHQTGQHAAAAWAMILSHAIDGQSVDDASRSTLGQFNHETEAAIRAALSAPRDGAPETVERLGGGWIAEEALAIALYSVLAGEGDLERTLQIAVTHSGDSDSTGAIAGNLFGVTYPAAVLAHPWSERIECVDLIRKLAHDLVRSVENAEGMWDEYPGW